MGIDTSMLAFPKGEARKRTKGRKRRAAAKVRISVRSTVVYDTFGLCERCGVYVGDDGHAHHRIPRSRGGKWTVSNIELLCAGCHQTAHRTNAL